MRTRCCIIGLVLLAAACSREPLFPGTSRHSHQPDAGRHAAPADATLDIPPGEHIFLTAVRYPDGFDWMQDTCAVDGTVWIDLYMDGKRIRSFPAGASVHSDRHRFKGGLLYADYSTEKETVVLCDGTERFRFPGREALRGFLVREDGVHTLGQDRDGNGFTYRIEGRKVFRSETGVVLDDSANALTEYGEDVFYACRLPTEQGMEYRVMRSAEVFYTAPQGEGMRAFGFVGGKVCRVQSSRRSVQLDVDGTSTRLEIGSGEALRWCRLLPWQDRILVLACVSGVQGRRFFLQTSDGRTYLPPSGETVTDACTEGGRMGWTETDGDGNLLRFRWSDGSDFYVGAGFYLSSGRCLLLRDGHLLLALTGRGGASNRFQMDAETTEIPFNGYFTSVTVE